VSDLNIFEIDESSSVVAQNLDGMEFWRAQYTKRRIYTEQGKQQYIKIREIINYLNKICQIISGNHPEGIPVPTEEIAYSLLADFHNNKKLPYLITPEILRVAKEKPESLLEKIDYAYNLSCKYCYVITQMGLPAASELINNHELVAIINRLEKRYWKDKTPLVSPIATSEKIPSERYYVMDDPTLFPQPFLDQDGFTPIGFIGAKMQYLMAEKSTVMTFKIPDHACCRLTNKELIKLLQAPVLKQQLSAISSEIDNIEQTLFQKIEKNTKFPCDHNESNSYCCSYATQEFHLNSYPDGILCIHKPNKPEWACDILLHAWLYLTNVLKSVGDKLTKEKNSSLEDLDDLTIALKRIIKNETDENFPEIYKEMITGIVEDKDCVEKFAVYYKLIQEQKNLEKTLEAGEIKLAKSNGHSTRALALIAWDLIHICGLSWDATKDKIKKLIYENVGLENKAKNLNTIISQLEHSHYPTTNRCITDNFIYPLSVKPKISWYFSQKI